MTMIENEDFKCAKTVSYKVMIIKNQKGYRWYQGHLGGFRGVGAIRGYCRVLKGVGGWQGV